MVRERRIFKNCPYCGASVRDMNFDHHLAKVHSIVTESLHKEESTDEAAFIKDYVERKCLVKPPKNLQDLEKTFEEAEEEWHRPKVPSAGTLLRFILRRYEGVYGALQTVHGKYYQPHIDLPQPALAPNMFAEKAKRTSNHKPARLSANP